MFNRNCRKAEITNAFPPTNVVCRHRSMTPSRWGGAAQEDDVLEFVDSVTGTVVLEVGTENTDDYYPCFVARFDPTAMAVNAGGSND